MPRVIDCQASDQIELEEVVDFMFSSGIDVEDEESFATAAPLLKRLSNNRKFLSRMVIDELANYKSLQTTNNYTAQVFMLYAPQRKRQSFFMRACFWPANADHVVRVSGTDPFFYHKPHDHNFNFLTVGYHGPGYWSDYYEYDYDETVGVKGEKANIRFVEKSRISLGKVMLYRAFKDIHNQLPADEFSVTVNIMENSLRSAFLDQYAFDPESNTITGLINRISADGIFPIAAALKDEDLDDVLLTIARKHPISRFRLSAYNALASAKKDPQEAIKLWNTVTPNDPEFLREWSRHWLDRLDGVAA